MLTYADVCSAAAAKEASFAKRVEELDDLDEATRATVLELGFEIKMTKKVLMSMPYVIIRQHMSAYVSIRHARACART
jgi:hypothetical protein